MLKNYFKIAWRHLFANKLHSVINIAGLSVGMAVAMLIGLWIWDEVSFDHWHANHSHIVEAMETQFNNGQASTSGQVAIPLRAELATRYGSYFTKLVLATNNNELLLSAGDKKVSQFGMAVQPDFVSLFSLKMLQGSPDALKDPSSIVLSHSAAIALFGAGDPMGKNVDIDGRMTLKVAAVYEDLPVNTTLSSARFLIAWDKYIAVAGMGNAVTNWGNNSNYLYAQLSEGTDLARLNGLIKGIAEAHMPGSKETIFLHPMDRWHLYSDFKDGKEAGGRIQFVWLFSIIGGFVLLLACINFMNLSTARSEKRAKEVGIRKAIGSLRGQLIRQFLTESFLMALLSLCFAIALVQVSLPFFNQLADKQISLPSTTPVFWMALLGFTLFTGLISGSYPAFYLSGVEPVEVLKGTFRSGRGAVLPRRILVVLQFTVSVALILGTAIVYKQILYAKDRSVGYSREGLIYVNLHIPQPYKYYNVLRQELLQTGAVASVAESSSPSTHIWNHYGDLDWKGKDPRASLMFGMVAVTHDFGRAMGWQIKEGRDFSTAFATDTNSFILNEAAAKLMGSSNPVGKVISWEGKDHMITGVVKNMITESPFEPVQPTVYFLRYDDWLGFLTIRIKQGQPVSKALAVIEPVFSKYNAGGPFEYTFVEEEYGRKFADEQRIGSLATVFAVLAIFISCLGLFGLASFVAERRGKEVSVRKVLGASTFSIWQLLSKEFFLLVSISCCIAGPVSYYFMHGWLQQYSYRTEISWWVFAAAVLGALLITLLTVSVQALKAAFMNPAERLREG